MSAAAQPAGALAQDRAAQLAALAERLRPELKAIAAAEAPEPEARPASRSDTKIVITLPAPLDEVTAKTLAALAAANCPPRIFRFNRALARLDFPAAELEPMTEGRITHEAATAAAFKHQLAREVKDVFPPREIARNILATPAGALPFPELERIAGGPAFAADGTLRTAVGYHADEKIVIAKAVAVPEFEGSPAEAAQWILDDVFADFPLADDASRANLLGFLVTLTGRRLYRGATPMFGFTAASPGTGKGLLQKTALACTIGAEKLATLAWSENPEEIRKRLFAVLLGAPELVTFDNVRLGLDDATLAALLTADEFSDRPLGTSEVRSVKVNAVFSFSANNPSLSAELARREVEIRLLARSEAPWLRDDFRHPDAVAYATENRGRVLAALARMVSAWTQAGRPAGSARMGSFEGWAATVSGILETAGVHGLLENRRQVFDFADAEGQAWREFVARWAERFGDRETTSSELFEIARGIDGLSFRGVTDKAQATSFGSKLSRLRDRFFGPWQVIKVPSSRRGAVYRLHGGSEGCEPY